MTALFTQWGNILFHTRNVLFPVLVVVLLFAFPPVSMDDTAGLFFLFIGCLLIAVGQALRMLTIGLAYIIRGGRQRRIYAEKLVTDGMFSHCRNPLYVGNVMITSGFFFVSGNLLGIVIGSLIFAGIYSLIICSEESFLRNLFGQAYQDFCNDVPRWLPRLTGLRETIAQYDFDWAGVAVKEYGTVMTSLVTPLIIIAWKLQVANRLADNAKLLISTAVVIFIAYGTVRFLKKTQRLRSAR